MNGQRYMNDGSQITFTYSRPRTPIVNSVIPSVPQQKIGGRALRHARRRSFPFSIVEDIKPMPVESRNIMTMLHLVMVTSRMIGVIKARVILTIFASALRSASRPCPLP